MRTCSPSQQMPRTENKFIVEQSHPEPIDLSVRVDGPIENRKRASVNEDAARLFAVSEPASREVSLVDVAGTDIESETLSTITEHTELPDLSYSSFFESNESGELNLLLNANFANAPRNNYGTPILADPPLSSERLIRRIPPVSINNANPVQY